MTVNTTKSPRQRLERTMATRTKAGAEKNGNGAIKAESWSDDPEREGKNAAHLNAVESAPVSTGKPIVLPRLDVRTLQIRIIGDSELIVHRWSEKAKKQILDKQMGRATAGKELKDPERDYQDSAYVLELRQPFESSKFGFPTIGFKNAAVSACTSLGKAVTKVAARQAFHVCGEFAVIEGEPRLREDMVRVGQGTADIRYRAGFPQWATTLVIRYNARVLTDEQICNLFSTAGFAVGVGEWRSERDGGFGLFHVG